MELSNLKTTALAVGSTSVLALIASTGQSMAEGLYMGFSMGVSQGNTPSTGDGYTDQYDMSGSSMSGFIGIQGEMANDMFSGVELAFTGPTEGDKDNNSSYEYAYDTNYTLDAKARIGKHMGGVDVYGFGGLSTGSVATCCYGADYKFTGVNVGVGAQAALSDNMFAGIEYIHRFTQGVGYDRDTSDVDTNYKTSHGTLSLRIGYKF